MRSERPTIETVVLDACCVLNLAATDRISEILSCLPYRFCLGSRARGEVQWLRIPGSDERERIDLQPLFDQGLVEELLLSGLQEEALFVQFGATLADGEAEAAALAVGRGHALATDDRKARRLLAGQYGGLRLVSTLELLREWQGEGGISDAILSAALRGVSERATYRPRRTDPLWQWWADLIGE